MSRFELKVFRHLWGVDRSWEEVFPKFKQEGYAGIETGLPAPEQRGRFRSLLDQHGFEYIPQIFTTGPTPADHIESFRTQLTDALTFKPLKICCHSGRDRWPAAESRAFYAEVVAIEKSAGVVVAHETHRGRTMYNPWATVTLLDQFPELKLCCDFSHWVVVCERLLDEESIIHACASRAAHVHARVGYEEGPQVPDPAAPEYRRHLEAHEKWWDMVWKAQAQRGDAQTTLTPEFGPPTYMHTLPHTHVPVADLWNVCNWQAKRQRERFAAKYGQSNANT